MLQCVNTGPVAQRLEQGTHNPLVPGSNPGGPILDSEFRIGSKISLRATFSKIIRKQQLRT
jgi:hypothetical protein